ncbi:hypothetical protein Pint_23644 [Pistacia integerrima]|uniref:Uncharacterized protein n=1 Tax=Pistacia integerrima TaxID=434235 RepID=A0ACC0YL20_9ROSI|nr:hypothetical protein Pint_23644 [Pistacia integerrima]
MKNHLARTHIQVKPCSQVPEDVKMKFQELLVAKKVNKEDDDDDDDDMVDIFKQQDVNPNTGKRPLHAAAYYLNPKYHYDPNFNPDKDVKIGLYKVIEKMYPDVETRVEVDAQLDKFKRRVGLFGMDMTIITRDKKQPKSDDEWIMGKEDPCLPDDNSWVDVQECFNIDEGAPSNKRAKGISYFDINLAILLIKN